MFNLFGKKKEEAQPAARRQGVAAPMDGKMIPIGDVPDPVFSQKLVGDGFAIEPSNGIVTAPVSGELVQLFPTKHAFGIKTAEGLEVLVHVGIDTVQLKGEGFASFATVGDQVKQGQIILEVDLEVLKNAGKSIITPVIITNMTDIKSIEICGDTGFAESGKITLEVEFL